MEITKQNNRFECGLCVLSTLIKHYHGKEIGMHELLNQVDISNGGISLYDLENLSIKYNIKLESYNATFEDFKEFDKDSIFVLLINNNNDSHYVICKRSKKENHFTIYCSVKGRYEISFQELSMRWGGILLTCEVIKENVAFSYKNLSQNKIDYKWLLINNVINIIHLIISLFCSLLMQTIMKIIQYDIIAELFMSVTIVFIMSFFINNLISWFVDRITKKYMYQKYQLIHSDVIAKMLYKYESFYSKMDYNYLINFDEYIFVISSFYSIKLNNIFSSIMTLMVVFFIFAFSNILLLIVMLIFISILCTIHFIRLNFQKQNLEDSKNTYNKYQNSIIEFINNNKDSHHANQILRDLNTLKKHQTDVKFTFFKNTNFTNNLNLVDACINSVFNIFLGMTGAFLVTNKSLTLNDLILLISLSQMVNTSSKELCSIPMSLCELKHANRIIDNILQIDNIEHNNMIPMDTSINKIKINNFTINNDTLLTGSSGSGKTYLLKSICNKIKSEFKIYINELEKDFISNEWINKNCIYINQNTSYEEQAVERILRTKDRELLIELSNLMNIKGFNKNGLSSGQKQALLFLTLLEYENKIILIDEALSNIDNEAKIFLLTHVKNRLINSNFLITVDHNSEVKKHFKKEVKINEILK
ncbi:MAG: cysteine peptidase family C39 domain-containing protein [Mycoplasma sp.]